MCVWEREREERAREHRRAQSREILSVCVGVVQYLLSSCLQWFAEEGVHRAMKSILPQFQDRPKAWLCQDNDEWMNELMNELMKREHSMASPTERERPKKEKEWTYREVHVALNISDAWRCLKTRYVKLNVCLFTNAFWRGALGGGGVLQKCQDLRLWWRPSSIVHLHSILQSRIN